MGLLGNAPEILANVNPSINTAMNNGYDFAQKAQQDRQAQKTYQRQQDFMNALGEEVQKVDYSKPEGQQALVKALGAKGFGPEAFALSKEFPKPAPNSYDFISGPQGVAAGNKQTGDLKVIPGFTTKEQEADLADKQFAAMKPTLDKFMAPANPDKGWNPLNGEKGMALNRASTYIPADVRAKSPAAQKWMDDHNKEQQQTVFNPATADLAGSRKLGIYVSKFDHAQEAYEKKATPLQNLIGTMNSPTWGTAAGDVSLINQLSLAEFGGYKPSEAEYKAFGKGFTPEQYAQKWLGMAQSGNTLPAEVRNNMVKEVEEVSRKTHENFKKTMEEQKKRVVSAGVNPDDVIYPGGTFQDLEGYFNKQVPAAAKPQAPAKAHPADNAMLQWAKQNPDAPGAADVLKANGQ